MPFIVEKDRGLIPQVLSSILDECVNGVTLEPLPTINESEGVPYF
jgi:hypothetical protein